MMARATSPSGGGTRQQRAAKLRAEDERRLEAEREAAQRSLVEDERTADSEIDSDEQFDFNDEQPADPIGTGPIGSGEYVVKQGDCMDSIAFERGFFWETIWSDADNAELKNQRTHPNVLLPDDRVTIPAFTRKEEPGETEMRHRFLRKGCPEILQIRLLTESDKPRADLRYTIEIDGNRRSGVTDAQGVLREPISPYARGGKLILGEFPNEELALNLGHLDPVTEVSGVQGRLLNLGFEPGPIDSILGPLSRAAIMQYQHDNDMDVTGRMDQILQDKLAEHHGS